MEELLAKVKEWIGDKEYVKVTNMSRELELDFMVALDIIDKLVDEGILDRINVQNKGFKVLR